MFVALPVGAFVAVVWFAWSAFRAAEARDRSPVLWTALCVASAGAAAFGAYSWLASSLGSDAGLMAGAFALVVAPALAPGLVVLLIHRLPPGRVRIRGPIAVRRVGTGGETLTLAMTDEGLVLTGRGGAEERIASAELERVVADGECLRLATRGGSGDRLFQVVEFDGPQRRRRAALALAVALTRDVARARVVSG